jgi:hypothetical protein
LLLEAHSIIEQPHCFGPTQGGRHIMVTVCGGGIKSVIPESGRKKEVSDQVLQSFFSD